MTMFSIQTPLTTFLQLVFGTTIMTAGLIFILKLGTKIKSRSTKTTYVSLVDTVPLRTHLVHGSALVYISVLAPLVLKLYF